MRSAGPLLVERSLRCSGWRRVERHPPFVSRRVFGLMREALVLQHGVERNRLKRGNQQQLLPGTKLSDSLHDFGERVFPFGKIRANIKNQRRKAHDQHLSLRSLEG